MSQLLQNPAVIGALIALSGVIVTQVMGLFVQGFKFWWQRREARKQSERKIVYRRLSQLEQYIERFSKELAEALDFIAYAVSIKTVEGFFDLARAKREQVLLGERERSLHYIAIAVSISNEALEKCWNEMTSAGREVRDYYNSLVSKYGKLKSDEVEQRPEEWYAEMIEETSALENKCTSAIAKVYAEIDNTRSKLLVVDN